MPHRNPETAPGSREAYRRPFLAGQLASSEPSAISSQGTSRRAQARRGPAARSQPRPSPLHSAAGSSAVARATSFDLVVCGPCASARKRPVDWQALHQSGERGLAARGPSQPLQPAKRCRAQFFPGLDLLQRHFCAQRPAKPSPALGHAGKCPSSFTNAAPVRATRAISARLSFSA